MIAYIALLPTELNVALIHRLSINRKDDCVFIFHDGIYSGRDYRFVPDVLKENGIFNDVIPCNLVMNFKQEMSEEDIEKYIVENFDKALKNNNYCISDFERIYVICDTWDGWPGIYLNSRKIQYCWLQSAENYVPHADKSCSPNYTKILNKYNAVTAFAEYCVPCIIESSDVTRSQLDGQGKKYTTWDKKGSFECVSDQDMKRLFASFRLEDYHLDSSKLSALIIKNSIGFLSGDIQYKKIAPYLNFYSYFELFSVMDKVSLDFYAPQAENIYIKCHINDPLDDTEINRLYGSSAINLPNVPFEIFGKFMSFNHYKIDKIIGTISTSLQSVSADISDDLCVLGTDFSKSWWYYISIYAALCFAQSMGSKEIYCDNPVLSQAIKLTETMGSDMDFYELKTSRSRLNKDSLVLIDVSECPLDFFSATGKQYTVIYINSEYNNGRLFENPPTNFVPIQIKKEKMSDIECDILYRDETLWIYSPDINVRKAAVRFVFERTLKNLGMKIYSERVSVSECIKIFNDNQIHVENRTLKNEIARLERRIDFLTNKITEPDSLDGVLKKTTDINDYFDILNLIKSRYLIVLAVRDTPGDLLSDQSVEKIRNCGFTNFSKSLWQMYIGVSLKSSMIFNRSGDSPESPIEYSTDTGDVNVNITSKAWMQGNEAKIIINGIDYSVNQRGINLVVYDVERNRLVDSVGFDMHTAYQRVVRKENM